MATSSPLKPYIYHNDCICIVSGLTCKTISLGCMNYSSSCARKWLTFDGRPDQPCDTLAPEEQSRLDVTANGTNFHVGQRNSWSPIRTKSTCLLPSSEKILILATVHLLRFFESSMIKTISPTARLWDQPWWKYLNPNKYSLVQRCSNAENAPTRTCFEWHRTVQTLLYAPTQEMIKPKKRRIVTVQKQTKANKFQ